MTRVELYNQALAAVGTDRIFDENQHDRNGQECRRHYKPSCRNILAQFEWSCAMTRQLLTQIEEGDEGYNADLYPYEYQYALPADCLKIVSINGSRETPRLKERRYLYTNTDEVILSYIADVSEPDSPADELPFPDPLCDTIARFMAYSMYRVVSPKMNPQVLYAEYQQAMLKAQEADGMDRFEDEPAEGWIV